MATFILSNESPLWRHADNKSDREMSEQAVRGLQGWTAAPIENVSLKWWGFENDTKGPDVEVINGSYHKLIDYLAGKGGDVCLNSVVSDIQLDREDGEFQRTKDAGVELTGFCRPVRICGSHHLSARWLRSCIAACSCVRNMHSASRCPAEKPSYIQPTFTYPKNPRHQGTWVWHTEQDRSSL